MEWTDFWCIAGSGSQDAFVAFQALGQDTPLAVSFVHMVIYNVCIHILSFLLAFRQYFFCCLDENIEGSAQMLLIR